jgi:glycolate oxidase iron-sulfur subunit
VFSEIKNETAAPRGHVFKVGMLRDGKIDPSNDLYERLARCLMCETCSVNCPSGIDVHELNAAARSYIYEKSPHMGKELIFDTMWTKPGLLRTMSFFMWGAQKSGLQKLARTMGLTRILPGDLPKAEKILSNVPLHSARSKLKEVNPPRGEKKYSIGYFLGCGTDLFNPQVALATVDVLTRNGCEVIIPPNMKCCGLPHIANGKMETAQSLAAHNIKIFNSYDFDYIVTDCASCSSALVHKHMEFLFKGLKIEDEAYAFSAKVMDLTKFLIDILDIKILDNKPAQKVKVTYHDPCHLANAQGITKQPRELLQRIPGVEFVEMGEANRCCGGSGTYSVTHYDMSMKILDRKMDSAMETGAQKIATCCPSCMMQLKYGTVKRNWDAEVVHPIQLLSSYYNEDSIKK